MKAKEGEKKGSIMNEQIQVLAKRTTEYTQSKQKMLKG